MMNVVITGASKGIGYETAKLLVRSQATVFALSRDAARLNQLAVECSTFVNGGSLVPIVWDLTDASFANLEYLENKLKEETQQIDILINNAGYLYKHKFVGFPENEARQIMEVNYFGPARLIQLLLPFMGKKNRSHILNISSMGGFMGSTKFPELAYYGSSKAAIAALTEHLAEEFKDAHISFNCLALGAVQTDMLNAAFPGYKAPVTAEQMAVFVAEFAMNGHKFFNGKVLPVALSTP